MILTCPNCNEEQPFSVVDSRQTKEMVRRRRKCDYCGVRISTLEIRVEGLVELFDELPKMTNKLRSILDPDGNILNQLSHYTTRPDLKNEGNPVIRIAE